MDTRQNFMREEIYAIASDDGRSNGDNRSSANGINNYYGWRETLFGSIGRQYQERLFPLTEHRDSTASLISQHEIIIYDEELIRHQEDQNRAIRRRRLIIRPVVIFVLGLFVFRDNNSFSYNNGSIGIFFHSLLRGNSSAAGLRKSFEMDQERDDNSNHYRSNSDARQTAYLFGEGNPSASAYNIVTDMNDDDYNDDIPSGILDRPSSNKTTEGGHHRTHNPLHPTRNKKVDKINTNDRLISYGWVPDSYPDPWIDPIRCGIAYLAAGQLQLQQQYHANKTNDTDIGTISEQERRGASLGLEMHGPRLCDPDWVFGAVYLERIAKKMQEFSDRFTVGDLIPEQISIPSPEEDQQSLPPQRVELAVATVRKMNVRAVLREEQLFFAYGDEDDMVNDAAQIFARSLHNRWWQNRNQNKHKEYETTNIYNKSIGDDNTDPLHESSSSRNEERRRNQQEEFFQTGGWYNGRATVNTNHNNQDFGILIFLSIQDRVCFISTGNAISTILPWWRLEHIVASMKPDLRHRDYGGAIATAIDDLSEMLENGPPTFEDRLSDFVARFGIVVGFAVFTFLFGVWGECRDRRKRWQYAESRSQLNSVEREKARLKQKEFQTKACPICLEPFTGEEEHCDDGTVTTDKTLSTGKKTCGMVRVDTYGIPLEGADSKNIKLLRCGHIFCESCWKAYVRSGHGNPSICPVCRQDVGKSSSKKRRSKEQRRAARRARREAAAAAAAASTATPAVASIEQMWLGNGENRALSGNGLAAQAYGSLNNTPDATSALFSSASDIADNLDSHEPPDDGEHENSFFVMGVNLLASAFGPTSSARTMNHDRTQHDPSDLPTSAFGTIEQWA